jgi:hypothetical protein
MTSLTYTSNDVTPARECFEAMMEKGRDQIPDEGFNVKVMVKAKVGVRVRIRIQVRPGLGSANVEVMQNIRVWNGRRFENIPISRN